MTFHHRPAPRFALSLDAIIARDAARNWSFADAVAALRRCGSCAHHNAAFPGICTAHNLWKRAGDAACGRDYEHAPDDDDYSDEIGAAR